MPLPEHTVASNKYGQYCVPVSSKTRPAAAVVLAGKVWEWRTIAHIAQRCGDGDIVHAGAYFGDFIPPLSKALSAEGHLWAFEPSSDNHACANRTMELNAITNATLFHAGLGARAGVQMLRIGRPGDPVMGGASRFAKREKEGFIHENARVVALDDVVPATRKVSVLQLDVEGSEGQALMGALKTIKRCLPQIILESLPKDRDWFDRAILGLGYREIAKVHSNTVFAALDQQD
jgi:FkbM family methyltransferase